MASISSPAPNAAGFYSAKGFCQIVGFVCLAGFIIDVVVLALPPDIGNLQWRAGLMQQVSDRSIVLLLGTALTLFGCIENRRWLKRLSRVSLIIGVAFVLSSLIVVADSAKLQQQAVSTISNQESQLQTQIQTAQTNPSAVGENVTSQDLQRFSKELTSQANALKSNAKTSALKLATASVGNLVVIGLGMISLGLYGMRLRIR
ncbi:hypothetical protein IQ268_13130 [Oculatella sp. LEGE 06141]|uniref:HpsJ-like protein, cyanoexosortase C-associated n=1 Tax=Oculatella sp. LEGE 06141 TaxID=1828648 RepID=UPI001881D0DA|nr:HpsJ family protein [Oculatella sp. LEGE 06141]MBE9179506.1 hypothetical protein [Oculatella sp. LEGE 06141]